LETEFTSNTSMIMIICQVFYHLGNVRTDWRTNPIETKQKRGVAPKLAQSELEQTSRSDVWSNTALREAAVPSDKKPLQPGPAVEGAGQRSWRAEIEIDLTRCRDT
jgi:hypothetical protein